MLKYNIVDEEIIKVILYYESISYNLGLRFESEIEKALDKLETNAEHYFIYQIKNTGEFP